MKDLDNKYEHQKEIFASILSESEKSKSRDHIMELLKEYPDNFFTGKFEPLASADFESDQIAVAKEGERIIGCLFCNPDTHECNWLAVSKNFSGKKRDVARMLFGQVFNSVPHGTTIFWYVNTEDAKFEGKYVGEAFEPARQLYEEMATTRTRVENKFGEGNHAYLIEKIV